jgi:hypothetical protein
MSGVPVVGILVDGGNAYLLTNHISALIVEHEHPLGNEGIYLYRVSAILDDGRTIKICGAESYEDAKEKLERWSRLINPG